MTSSGILKGDKAEEAIYLYEVMGLTPNPTGNKQSICDALGVYDKQQIYDTLNYYGIHTDGAYGGRDKGKYGKGEYKDLVDEDTIHRFIKSRSHDFKSFVDKDIAQGTDRYTAEDKEGGYSEYDFSNIKAAKSIYPEHRIDPITVRDLILVIILGYLSYRFIPFNWLKWTLTIFFGIATLIGIRALYRQFTGKS